MDPLAAQGHILCFGPHRGQLWGGLTGVWAICYETTSKCPLLRVFEWHGSCHCLRGKQDRDCLSSVPAERESLSQWPRSPCVSTYPHVRPGFACICSAGGNSLEVSLCFPVIWPHWTRQVWSGITWQKGEASFELHPKARLCFLENALQLL